MHALLSCLLLLQAIGLVFSAPIESRSLATTLWDVIVVGSGPAGIIVASRLSENATKNVLLLEGGGPSYYVTGGTERPAWLAGTSLSRVDVPGLYLSIFSNPSPMSCGKLLNAYGACTIGGNSAINAGLFFEPPASDFDTYFPTGWKHADLVPSINRLYQTQPSTNNPSQDGIRYLQSGYTAAKNWLCTGAGAYTETDINANAATKTKVFGHPAFDYSNGQRGGPVISYLQSALTRPNFHFQSGAWVQRVTRTGNVATGVIANVSGVLTTYSLSAKGRVILSAGALKSPELLMKSAIGDPAVLTRLQQAGQLGGVPPSSWLNNSAVGAGLFDNPNTFIELSSPSIQAYSYTYDNPPAADQALYLQKRSGPYSFAGPVSVFWDYIKHADGTLAGMQGTIGTAGYSAYTNGSTVTLNIYGTSGLKSSGKVVLDANFVPGPDGNVYYSNPQDAQDIATFIYGIFQKLPGTGISPLNIPQSASVAQIVSYITTYSAYARGQVNHWSSSCRLGSCVDGNTGVVGMKNLHVVDGSIVSPLTVNPQMGIMIAAERAAELIAKL